MSSGRNSRSSMRAKVHEVIFEADTASGRIFDHALIAAILISVIMVMLESIEAVHNKYGRVFLTIEWIITILFTVEYILRVYSIKKPLKYIFSFYGLVDLLSILPTYFGLFLTGKEHSLVVIRALRLLRIFRLLKLARYVNESRVLINGLRRSIPKITVFILAVFTLIIIIGTIMYMLEGSHEDSNFDSIPTCMYWAIVTLSTVGYGDLTPITVPGKMFASLVMLCGYGVIAVPPAIVTIGMVEQFRSKVDNRSCASCGTEGHEPIATYCYKCGAKIAPSADDA